MAADTYPIELGFRVLSTLRVGTRYLVVTYEITVAGQPYSVETLVLSGGDGDPAPLVEAA